jgi:hypothetical protein
VVATLRTCISSELATGNPEKSILQPTAYRLVSSILKSSSADAVALCSWRAGYNTIANRAATQPRINSQQRTSRILRPGVSAGGAAEGSGDGMGGGNGWSGSGGGSGRIGGGTHPGSIDIKSPVDRRQSVGSRKKTACAPPLWLVFESGTAQASSFDRQRCD